MAQQSRERELVLPARDLTVNRSEQVGATNPLAHEVAKPLLDAGITLAQMRGFTSGRRTPLKPPRPKPPTSHRFSLLLKGRMETAWEDDSCVLKPGQMCYTPPGMRRQTRYFENEPAWFCFIVIQEGPQWEPLAVKGRRIWDYESAEYMYILMRGILDAHVYRNIEAIQLAQSMCHGLIELLKHEMVCLGRPTNPHADRLRAMVNEIRESPEEDWNSESMAEQLNVSVSVLYRLFKLEFGMPPHEMVIRQRVATACERLVLESLTIEQIAADLGYNSVHSFSHLFKQRTGMRPGEYRKKFNQL